MYRLGIAIVLLSSHCMTAKLLDRVDGTKHPLPVQNISSLSMGDLNKDIRIRFDELPPDSPYLHNCYDGVLVTCESESQWIHHAELKEINPRGGIHFYYDDRVFLHPNLSKFYANNYFRSNFSGYHPDRLEIYATKDGEEFLLVQGAREYYTSEYHICPEKEYCTTSRREDFVIKLEEYDLEHQNLLILLDSKGNTKSMYTFHFPSRTDVYSRGRVVTIDSIPEKRPEPYYYLLVPFSIIGDTITAPLQFPFFLRDLYNGCGAAAALG